MPKRSRKSRYQEMESLMMKVLIADGVLFFIYMFAASKVGGWEIVKIVTAIFSLLISVLVLVYLYMTKEISHRRSLWMVTACIAVLACLLVSLCLGYPCPPVVSALSA